MSGTEFASAARVFAVLNEMRAKARATQMDVVDLGMGNPDGGNSKVIVASSAKPPATRVSLFARHPQTSRGICARYKRNCDVDLDPERKAIRHHGYQGFTRPCSFAVIGPGDVVAAPNPAYPIHQYGVIMAEGHSVLLPMPTAEEFLNRLEALYRESPKPPKMLLISFPHNPTTTCVDLPFLAKIVDLARKRSPCSRVRLRDYGFDGYKPPSILQVPGAKDLAVEIFSMSKSYEMAGWRIGYCLGNQRMIAALARIKSYLDYGSFQPIQIASIVALRECEEDTKRICASYQHRRDVLVDGLAKAGWNVEPPKGTMFLWAELPEKFKALGSGIPPEASAGLISGFSGHRFRTAGRRFRPLRTP